MELKDWHITVGGGGILAALAGLWKFLKGSKDIPERAIDSIQSGLEHARTGLSLAQEGINRIEVAIAALPEMRRDLDRLEVEIQAIRRGQSRNDLDITDGRREVSDLKDRVERLERRKDSNTHNR